MNHPFIVFHAFLVAALLFSAIVTIDAFFISYHLPSTLRSQQTTTSTYLNLFWFGNKDNDKENSSTSEKRLVGDGGVAQVMDSMENFKTTQQVGSLTSTYVQGLTSTIIEGSSADGKVKVFVDGQQYPKRVEIDEAYGETVDVDDLNTALVAAMQDAYIKSREKMQEKMKDLYTELGMPPSSSATP